MNAARQRQLTPLLGALCVLAAAAWLAFAFGLGRKPHWRAHGPAAQLPAEAVSTGQAPPPLQHFASTWQQPLFNAERKPVAESDEGGQQVRLGDLELTGIILTPGLRMALLRDRDGNDVRVREGASLPDGSWTLQKLEPRAAVFTGHGQRTELKLKVADRIDAHAGPGNAPQGNRPGAAEARAVGPGPGSGHADAHGAMPAHARTPQAPHRPTLQLKPPSKQAASGSQESAEQRAREQRIKALKARIQARRRQMQANQDQEH